MKYLKITHHQKRIYGLEIKAGIAAKTSLSLFFLIVFLCSCSQQPNSYLKIVSIKPPVIDFGKVRPTDSPIQTEFILQNNSDESIQILDMISDCGCTILDSVQRQVLPKSEIRIPVKINLFGKFGDFENKINIKISELEPISLIIKGKIITDIWFNNQSIRCTAESGQSASGIVELHTISYPDIVFDFSNLDKTMTIQEISRTTKNGETTIKFILTIEMGNAEESVRSLTFIPVEQSIWPITIPVYCYKNNSNSAFSPALKTQSIFLGTVYTGESHEVQIYGDPDIIGVIDQVQLQGFSTEISLPHFYRRDNDSINLIFQFPDKVENKSIDGYVKLITIGKREIILPVTGLLQNKIY